MHPFAGQTAAYQQLVASKVVGRTLHVQAGADSGIYLKLILVINQSHIYTATVGAVEVYYSVITSCQGIGSYQVFQYAPVFYLTHAYHGRALRTELVGSKFTQHIGQIIYLVTIFECTPTIGTRRRKLFVKNVWLVNGIEKVFHVIKRYRIDSDLAL